MAYTNQTPPPPPIRQLHTHIEKKQHMDRLKSVQQDMHEHRYAQKTEALSSRYYTTTYTLIHIYNII